MAAEEFEDIYLIDTLNVTAGLGAVVLYAAKLIEENPTISHIELIEKVEAILTEGMKQAAELAVTLEVEAHTGTNWYEAK